MLELDAEAIASEFEKSLHEAFASAGGVFLPYPEASHEKLVHRALARRRPFDSNGRDGYRDTVLWETLVAAASQYSPLVLVSADRAAFSPKGTTDLLPTLIEDLKENELAEDAIRRIGRIADFTDTLETVDEIQLEVEHLLGIPGDAKSMVEEAIVEEALDYSESQTSVIGLPLEVDQLYIESVQEISEIKVTGARSLDDTESAIELEARMTATLELYIRKGDIYAYDGDEISVVDYDYNESFVEATVDRIFSVEAEALFNSETKELTGVRTASFIGVDAP